VPRYAAKFLGGGGELLTIECCVCEHEYIYGTGIKFSGAMPMWDIYGGGKK
jgi:hypothetical protein